LIRAGNIGPKPTLVREKLGRSNVQAELAQHGFYNPWNRLSVNTLRQLPLEQYGEMMKLLAKVHNYVLTKLEFNEPVALVLPSAADLRAIKIEKIASGAKAFDELINRCVFIEHGVKLDLRDLPRIYQKFAV
jgi:hypothetical protein